MNGFLRTSVVIAVGTLGLGSATAQRDVASEIEAANIGAGLRAQVAVESEVRQIVTFSFLPGKSAGALAIFREQAMPLYEDNAAMLSFRGFREVESPVPLDLIVVSSFAGMSGMDASNSTLGALAAEAGTSIGAIYGRIGALTSGHTDEFVEMLPALGSGDPSSRRLTAFVWYQIIVGEAGAYEDTLKTTIVPWEQSSQTPSATGRFLLSDGWHYLRLLGFDSLADYQEYWSRLDADYDRRRIVNLTTRRREVIVAAIPDLAVR